MGRDEVLLGWISERRQHHVGFAGRDRGGDGVRLIGREIAVLGTRDDVLRCTLRDRSRCFSATPG